MRSALWRLLRWCLFRLDAETAHRVTTRLFHLAGIAGGAGLRWMSGTERRALPAPGIRLWDLEFGSAVGLAAGFDKDADLVSALPNLGFGFVEIGTVTPRPQPGNPAPRLFRDVARRALFNRMGFNGLGAALVSERLREARAKLPPGFRVGVNVGKNKDTSAEDAATDYARATAAFEGLADYLVINVSSPNTAGLRALQTLEALRPICGATNEVIGRWARRPPLLLKLAPEVTGEALADILGAARELGIDGWVLTNTLAGTYRLASGGELPGGWSGSPLSEIARERLIEARKSTALPIISVGGILDGEEARARIAAGASLVQIYSGWIFGGPTLPSVIGRALLQK